MQPSAQHPILVGESVMARTGAGMFEYACREANYSMSDILRGARFAEAGLPKRD
jgi:hypothetical protein